MSKLTEKQQQIYDFILDFSQEHGYPPSVREIAQAVDLKSPSTFTSRGCAKRDLSPRRKEKPVLFLSQTGPTTAGTRFPCWAMWRLALPFWPRRTLKNT